VTAHAGTGGLEENKFDVAPKAQPVADQAFYCESPLKRSVLAQDQPGRRFSKSAAYFTSGAEMKIHNTISAKRAEKAKRDRIMLCIRCGRAQKPRFTKGRDCYGCGEDMVLSADDILTMISSDPGASPNFCLTDVSHCRGSASS
jgi:hypothetical protein